MKRRLDHIDGLRFFAIMVIMASHVSAFGLFGQGSIWADFFMVLSGFFASRPVSSEGEEVFLTARGWVNYYILRFFRLVIPVWAVCVFFYCFDDPYLASKRILFNNLLFIDSSQHLWFIQHLLLACLFTPPVCALVGLVKKKLAKRYHEPLSLKWNLLIGIILLAFFIPFANFILHGTKLSLGWNGGHRKLFASFYFIGFSAGYLIKGIDLEKMKLSLPFRVFLDAASLALLLFLTYFSGSSFLGKISPELANYHIGWKKPVTVTLISLVLLLVIVVNEKGIVAKVLRLPIFVRFGRCSLDIYLIHYFLIRYFHFSPNQNFVILTAVTVPMAVLLTEIIEDPLCNMVRGALKKALPKSPPVKSLR